MSDLDLDWKGDLSLTPTGDLALVSGPVFTEQRIVRRLLTAVKGYVWHPEYGAGLPQRIGRVVRTRDIQALVRAQIALESSVAALPVPVTTVTTSDANPGLYVIEITYTDAVTGLAQDIKFEVPGSR